MEKNKKVVLKNNKINFALVFVYLAQVIASFFILFKVDKIIDGLVNTLKSLEGMIDESMINSMVETYATSSGRDSVILIILVCMGFSATGLIISLLKKSPKKKTLLIVFSAITLYESYELLSPIYAVLCFASLILSIMLDRNDVTTKTKENDDKKLKEEKEEKKVSVKKFKQAKVKKPVIIKSIIMIAIYIIYFFTGFPYLFDFLPEIVLNILFYGSLIAFAIGFYYKEYSQMFKAFKKNLKVSIKYIFNNLWKMLLIYYPFALIIVLTFGQSSNQSSISELNLITTLLLAVIYAPIVEETVFRGAIRKLIKNDLVFVLVSGIAFGLIHTIGQEPTLLLTLANAVPYAVLGCYFAYMYTENNNMMYNIGLHAVYNLMCTIILALVG